MNPICLITPPSPFLLDERVFLSLGILRVAACLERDGYTVEHLDLSGISNFEEAVRDHSSRSAAAIFGLTATTPQMPAAALIVKALREVRPDCRVILGGPHVTLVNAARKREFVTGRIGRASAAMDILHEMFDVLVAGDGDDAVFHAIMPHAPKLVDADDVKSQLFLTNDRYDEIPFPARHLVDVESYHYSIEGRRASSLIAQLGCPYQCTFCGGRNSAMLRRIRTRSTENIVAEIRHLHTKYDYTGIMCYDDQTDILTEDRGWIRFADLTPVDRVAVLNPASNELMYEIPKRIIRKPFNGDLVTVQNRFVDLAVTPEHRMWAKSERDGDYRHIEASQLCAMHGESWMLQRAVWQGDKVSGFSIPAYVVKYLGRNHGSPKVQEGERWFKADVWVKFMAWYLAEGSCYRPKVRNGRGYRICIKQHLEHNPEKVAEIKSVLDELGYRYSYSSNQFHIDSRELYEYLRQFGTSHYKHVPAEFKQMSSGLIRLFIDTYVKGDGSTSATGQQFIMSASKRMRDDLQEMAIKAGMWAYDSLNRDRIQLSRQRDCTINSRWGSQGQYDTIPYDGEVHCVTVSTGVILVRRNGKAVWSGNCYDDELNVNTSMAQLMVAIADLQQELGVEFRLRGFIKSNLFTNEQAGLMYRAGFRWILVGFESGSPRILENIQKKATREQNSKCMQYARDNGLKVKALMSIGHAGESAETIQDTKDWLLQEKPDDFDCTVISTYPGTDYYDLAIETSPGVWTFTAPRTGDRLHSYEVDFNKVAEYYKGIPGEYTSYVFTDYLKAEEIAQMRDSLEADVRGKLGIEYNHGAPGVQYEHSMGQSGLPSNILRTSDRALVTA